MKITQMYELVHSRQIFVYIFMLTFQYSRVSVNANVANQLLD